MSGASTASTVVSTVTGSVAEIYATVQYAKEVTRVSREQAAAIQSEAQSRAGQALQLIGQQFEAERLEAAEAGPLDVSALASPGALFGRYDRGSLAVPMIAGGVLLVAVFWALKSSK